MGAKTKLDIETDQLHSAAGKAGQTLAASVIGAIPPPPPAAMSQLDAALAAVTEEAVAAHLAWLQAQAPQAMMTGSGACVFASFSSRTAAEATLARLPDHMTGWVADGLPEHPLAKIL